MSKETGNLEQLDLFGSEKAPELEIKEEHKRARRMNPAIWMQINKTPIPYSFRGLVIKFCEQMGEDQHQAARVFYRAEASGATNPIKWIREGFKTPELYALKPCGEEYSNPKAVHDWITAYWYGKKAAKVMSSIKDVLREIVK